jgi:hypothetical protein
VLAEPCAEAWLDETVGRPGFAAGAEGDVVGAATTTGPRCGGAFFAAFSALRRSRIAFKASPGFDTPDRLKPWLAAGFAAEGLFDTR